MQQVLTGLLWSKALVYIDDVIVLGDSFNTALNNLREVLSRFVENNLKLKPKKCSLFQKEVEYLGRRVSTKGVSLKPEHLDTIRKWPVPRTKQQLESFLGFANYHRNFIKNYATLSGPLYSFVATCKSGPISLSVELVGVMEEIKVEILNAPILPYPNPDYTFILDCDASNTAIGSELSQIVEGIEHVISYASFTLTPAQRRYCTTRKELLAVVRCTECLNTIYWDARLFAAQIIIVWFG
jgi:hypothetical protein